ncbi:MAG TPA: hypothetical protein VKY85_06845 [Candidatus Angelobacter sp.]|nr:hypothetical protein [Candidatus Angelobacter sp.]
MHESVASKPAVASQLKKTEQELQEAHNSVKTGMINVKVLMEFRSATERARQATAAVQQWLEEQGKGNDPYQLMPRVLGERLNMATALLEDVICDLDGGDIDFETPGLKELHTTVKTLTERLVRLFPQ